MGISEKEERTSPRAERSGCWWLSPPPTQSIVNFMCNQSSFNYLTSFCLFPFFLKVLIFVDFPWHWAPDSSLLLFYLFQSFYAVCSTSISTLGIVLKSNSCDTIDSTRHQFHLPLKMVTEWTSRQPTWQQQSRSLRTPNMALRSRLILCTLCGHERWGQMGVDVSGKHICCRIPSVLTSSFVFYFL